MVTNSSEGVGGPNDGGGGGGDSSEKDRNNASAASAARHPPSRENFLRRLEMQQQQPPQQGEVNQATPEQPPAPNSDSSEAYSTVSQSTVAPMCSDPAAASLTTDAYAAARTASATVPPPLGVESVAAATPISIAAAVGSPASAVSPKSLDDIETTRSCNWDNSSPRPSPTFGNTAAMSASAVATSAALATARRTVSASEAASSSDREAIRDYLARSCGLGSDAESFDLADVDPSSLELLRGLASAASSAVPSIGAAASSAGIASVSSVGGGAPAISAVAGAATNAASDSLVGAASVGSPRSAPIESAFGFSGASAAAVLPPRQRTQPPPPNSAGADAFASIPTSHPPPSSESDHGKSDIHLDDANLDDNTRQQFRILRALEVQSGLMHNMQGRLDALGNVVARLERRLEQMGGEQQQAHHQQMQHHPHPLYQNGAVVYGTAAGAAGTGAVDTAGRAAGRVTVTLAEVASFNDAESQRGRGGRIGEQVRAGAQRGEGGQDRMEALEALNRRIDQYAEDAARAEIERRVAARVAEQTVGAPPGAGVAPLFPPRQPQQHQPQEQPPILMEHNQRQGFFFPLFVVLFRFLLSVPARLREIPLRIRTFLLKHTGPGRVYAYIVREARMRRAFADVEFAAFAKLVFMVVIMSGKMSGGGRGGGGEGRGGGRRNHRGMRHEGGGHGDGVDANDREGFLGYVIDFALTLGEFWRGHRFHVLVMAAMTAFILQAGLMKFFYEIIWIEREGLIRAYMGREGAGDEVGREPVAGGGADGNGGEGNRGAGGHGDGNGRGGGVQGDGENNNENADGNGDGNVGDENADVAALDAAAPGARPVQAPPGGDGAVVARIPAGGRLPAAERPLPVAAGGDVVGRIPGGRIRPGRDGGALQDFQSLILSFLLSLIPAWKPEEDPPAEGGAAPEQQRQGPGGAAVLPA